MIIPLGRSMIVFWQVYDCIITPPCLRKALVELKEISGKDCVKVLSRRDVVDAADKKADEVPWFPIKIAELDRFASQILRL